MSASAGSPRATPGPAAVDHAGRIPSGDWLRHSAAERLRESAAADPGLELFELPANAGKGASVLHGPHAARAIGFMHALTMDSDGQHPAGLIPAFMQASMRHPEMTVLGRPVFDASAPLLRRAMRRSPFQR